MRVETNESDSGGTGSETAMFGGSIDISPIELPTASLELFVGSAVSPGTVEIVSLVSPGLLTSVSGAD